MAALVWSGLVLALAFLLHTGVAHAEDQVVTNTHDDGTGSLRQAIRDVDEGGTITFALGGGPATIDLTTGELEIDKSLTIEGPGANIIIVSGGDASRVFSILSGNITLSGLTIAHGRVYGPSPEGGAIRNAGRLVLQQVVIESNQVESTGGVGFENALGGGLYNEGECLLDHSTVASNTAQGGPMTVNYGGDGSGGGIYNEGVMTVTASSLHDNLARGGTTSLRYGGSGQGGGLSNAITGTVTISASILRENQAVGGTASDRYGGTGKGGGLYSEGLTVVQDTGILTNTALGAGAYLYGGTGNGGGIYNYGSLGVTGGAVQGNLAKGAAGSSAYGGEGVGGGIERPRCADPHPQRPSPATPPRARPVRWRVSAEAGGVSAIGELRIEESTICGNQAVGGTGTYWTNGKVGGDADAGGVYSYAIAPAEHTILRSTVCDNLAMGGQGDSAGDGTAGGIYAYKLLTIDRSSVYGNAAHGGPSPANGSGGNGGAGGVYGLGDLTLQDTAVYSNTAQGGAGTAGYSSGGDGRGGGILQGYGGAFTVRASAVYSNTAQGGNSAGSNGGDGLGGGYSDSSDSYAPTVRFINSTIHGNRALRGAGQTANGTGMGGGLAAGIAGVGLSFCTVAGNTADDQGGGLSPRRVRTIRVPPSRTRSWQATRRLPAPTSPPTCSRRGHNLVGDTSGGTLDTDG